MLAVMPCICYNNNEMIESFGDKATEDLFHGHYSARVKHFPNEILDAALRKMDMLEAAQILEDLKIPPGNRLEALRSNLKGYFSIRVNAQWRIIFKWYDGAAYDVSLTDYH